YYCCLCLFDIFNYLLSIISLFFLSAATFHCFLFYYHAVHRYLHSFPTRRSSDLSSIVVRISSSDNLAPTSVKSGPDAPSKSAPRSEEHTSELQSRFDLVCRLLLEKKKYHL